MRKDWFNQKEQTSPHHASGMLFLNLSQVHGMSVVLLQCHIMNDKNTFLTLKELWQI